MGLYLSILLIFEGIILISFIIISILSINEMKKINEIKISTNENKSLFYLKNDDIDYNIPIFKPQIKFNCSDYDYDIFIYRNSIDKVFKFDFKLIKKYLIICNIIIIVQIIGFIIFSFSSKKEIFWLIGLIIISFSLFFIFIFGIIFIIKFENLYGFHEFFEYYKECVLNTKNENLFKNTFNFIFILKIFFRILTIIICIQIVELFLIVFGCYLLIKTFKPNDNDSNSINDENRSNYNYNNTEESNYFKLIALN